MLLKRVFILLIFCSSLVFAHRVAGVDMSLEKLEGDKILVKAFFSKSKKALGGNEVRLISMFDNRVLAKGKLTLDGLVLNIPSESYWVYVLVRDNDIVKDGLAPSGGFKKTVELKKIAFLYTVLASLFFLIISLFIAYKKSKKFKEIQKI
ncbi:hypothetical protein [Halarcobacter sp.]|uniref:hypothetical protein n=1 Tax=Halarcobacter sp. TaxID=2321133 RepID=UPI0029F51F24|nr:hypothetical protein [Halarcobacter sp.]